MPTGADLDKRETNGNPNYFLKPTFLNMILDTK